MNQKWDSAYSNHQVSLISIFFLPKTKMFHERYPFLKHGAHKQAYNRGTEVHSWKRLPRMLQTLDNKYRRLLEATGTIWMGPGLNSAIFQWVLLTMPHLLFCLNLIYYSIYKFYTSLKNSNFLQPPLHTGLLHPWWRDQDDDNNDVKTFLPVSISATANWSLRTCFLLISKTWCRYCLHITIYIKCCLIILCSSISTSIVGVVAANITITVTVTVTRCWSSNMTNSVFPWWLSEPD